ncbi:MAG: hydantoinase B/oxoprolinase family protein, partial [Rhodospirillaceae bacterium]|nr:hydantoinase B/oxoprolinase family protein [Rhodospirillaceae bacterium]
GGLYELELLEQSADVFLFGERGRYPPQGVAGGGPGACNIFEFDNEDGKGTPPLVSKMTGLKIMRGQRLRLESPGGGGYGVAFERPVEFVAEDVRLGYVSRDAAKRDYGVALDGEGAVDAAATEKLRKAAAS